MILGLALTLFLMLEIMEDLKVEVPFLYIFQVEYVKAELHMLRDRVSVLDLMIPAISQFLEVKIAWY